MPARFDGEVYKHLYQRFMDYMEKIRETHGTPGRRALVELQKRIAREGLYVFDSSGSPCEAHFADVTVEKRGTRMRKHLITWCSIDDAMITGRFKLLQCW